MDIETVYINMQLPKPLPIPGERIIVNRWEQFIIKVLYTEWIKKESRFKIHLDWGIHGKSYVYTSDEGKVWRRYLSIN